MPSKGEVALEALLREMFPAQPLRKQVPIKHKGVRMYLDFYHPGLRIAYEVQGEQHYQDNRFFYKYAIDFKLAQRRDKLKEDYCRTNGIALIQIKPTEISRKELAQKINDATTR